MLNDIPDFHVANGQMPQDVMHVILEGVLPYEMKMMLKVFIFDKRYFGLKTLNARLSGFVYGRNESRTKPPKSFERKNIAGESSLSLSGEFCSILVATYKFFDDNFFIASQAWTFAAILPLIVGHMIPEDDLHWECYLLLLQIIQYSTAKVTSSSSSSYLAALVDQHHQMFVQCYPEARITPKMHYMVHFAQQICR